ncbi:MAG: hypothetical protein WBB24_15590 [Maribacter sp.]
MNVTTYFFHIFLAMHFQLFAQNANTILDQVPAEKLYVHVNSSLLFTGEYLLYSLYCLDDSYLKPSKISKIAYVELIGEGLNSVFKQKLRLENGRSQADFFVPNSVPSGNYKLIAYTRWMKNFGSGSFFKQDITIINPYQSDQTVFLNVSRDSLSSQTISTVKESYGNNEEKVEAWSNGILKITLNRKEFSTREEIRLNLERISNDEKEMQLSISVRKIDSLPKAKRMLASAISGSSANSSQFFVNDKMAGIIPELRGDLISGKVMDKNTSKPVEDMGVSLSFPEYDSHFQTAFTDQNGLFHFSLNDAYQNEQAILQVLADSSANFEINTLRMPKMDYSNVTFHKFKLTRTMKDHILERSVQNQIENSFFSVKPDTVQYNADIEPFFLKNSLVYDLDDYTRFPTLRETVVEITDNLWTTKNSKGAPIFKVRMNPPYRESDKSPLLIVDGIHVQDHESMMEFNAKLIKKIKIGRNRYVIGKQVYEGSISIETIDGNYAQAFNHNSMTPLPLFTPEPKKKYYRQQYNQMDATKFSRIPDYRSQLFWYPKITLLESETFSFFTSDVTGDFEIIVEGFASDGSTVSLKDRFSVK